MRTGLGLSYEQAPPFGVPLLFIYFAPLVLLLAAVIAFLFPAAWLASRWLPGALALTHLITLGFLGLVMCGASLQMLPVVLGSPAPQPRLVGGVGATGLLLGTLGLAYGFWSSRSAWLVAGSVALAAGLLPLFVSLGLALWRTRSEAWIATPVRMAWLALLVTALLGWALVAQFSGTWIGLDVAQWTNLHAAWGLGGWIGLLVLGFAFQVVPMLQLTPPYPVWATRYLVSLLMTGLVTLALALWLPVLAYGALLILLLGGAGLAWATLRVQSQRKRKIGDVTLSFWRFGMFMLMLALVLLALLTWLPEPARVSFGPIFLLGFAGSAVNGMLYKIVPFLAWFHLQAQRPRGGKVPNMRELLPEDNARRQFILHVGAVSLLGLAPLADILWPEEAAARLIVDDDITHLFARLGAAWLAGSAWLLWRNLEGVRRQYRACGGRY